MTNLRNSFLVAALVLLVGCNGAAVPAETARAAACIQAETRCIDRAESGDISIEAAEACVSCTRATCDAIRSEILRRAGTEGASAGTEGGQ